MADKKITELTALTTLANEDLFVVVDDPSGTAVTKKITAATLLAAVPASPPDSDQAIIAASLFA
jgi:hypothetical protein